MKDSIAFLDLKEYHHRLIKYVQTHFMRLNQVGAESGFSAKHFPLEEGFLYASEMADRILAEKELDSLENGLLLPLHQLKRHFNLDFFQFFSILLSYCCEIDAETMDTAKKYMGRMKSEHPPLSLAVALVSLRTPFSFDCEAMNASLHFLFQYFFLPPDEGISIHAPLALRPEILEFLVSGISRRQKNLFFPQEEVSLSAEMKQTIPDRIFSENEKVLLKLTGEIGSGRKTLAKLFAQKIDRPLFFISLAELLSLEVPDFFQYAAELSAEARLWNAIVVLTETETAASFKHFSYYTNELLRALYAINPHIILTATKDTELEVELSDIKHYQISIPSLSYAEKLAMWETLLSRYGIDLSLKEKMAFKFQLTPSQAFSSIWAYHTLYSERETDEILMNRCCYNSIHTDLKKYADFIPPAFSWEQLILPKEIKESILNACSHIIHASQVYDSWGFGKRITYGRGVHLLFTGPPGTGKTMAAQVISSMLGIDLYKVDSSKLVSKYIGETEKNFELVFQAAAKSSVILFFDEMDSLFGKRSEVSEANDKYANATTSYLLQKIEEYDGVILMATNHLDNVDEAFMRRISYVMHFPMPSVSDRETLWRSMLETAPCLSKDIDFDFLSERFEMTGGVIKNIVLSAAFLAAAENRPISMKHLIRAIYYDLTKQGKTIIKSEFAPYDFYIHTI